MPESKDESAPDFSPELIQARWVLGGVSAEELVNQALLGLEHGFRGTALQQIAGLVNPTKADLENLPDRAFAEMGLGPLGKDEAAAFLIAHGVPRTSGPISAVIRAFPAFRERWKKHVEWWGGEPAGDYNDMAEFVHFVVEDLYENGSVEEVRRAFSLMEELIVGADQAAIDLIGLGFFETLQNVASWRPYTQKAFEPFLGPKCAQLWSEIERMWAGKSSLAEVLRAETHRD